MNSKQLRYVLLGLIGFCCLVFIVVCTLGLSALKSQSQKLVNLKLQNQVATDQLVSLAKARVEVAKYSYFKQVAKTVLPSDKNQAQAVVDIFQMAKKSGIALSVINFPTSSLGLHTSLGAAEAAKADVLSQATRVSGIDGLYSIELEIIPDTDKDVPKDQLATYPKMLNFLRQIENNRRTAQITEVTVQPISNDEDTPYISFSLKVNIFIKP